MDLRHLSRRSFLALVAAVAAATGLPEQVVAAQLQADPAALRAAAERTTLARTLGPGPPDALGYRRVASFAGEPTVLREELATAQAGREARRRSLLCFLHLTDQHVIDCESPARVEFTDRVEEGDACAFLFSSAWRPQEAASARIADAMLRQARAVALSPLTGAAIAAAICTGDNTDNVQRNELTTFLAVMDGGAVTPKSGDPAVYQGVQASGDLAYWHPDPAVPDRYKTVLGFPARAGWLEQALAPLTAVGAGMPWLSAFGNHDGLVQGNAPENPLFEGIATGPLKVVGPPPGNPCTFDEGAPPIGAPGGLALPATPDPERVFLSRAEWVQGHLDSPGLPAGHGFTAGNVAAATAYYAADVGPLRFIVLDTVNPAGFSEGSVGDAQLQWLAAELTATDEARRLALVFSHHGPRSLTNPLQGPDPGDPATSDLPRRLADEVLAVCAAHPSLIAWVNGHTHEHLIAPRGTFWDVGTAAHIDWPAQARLVEVVDNADGTLSILSTVIDHATDEVTGFARELAGNDRQAGFATGTGGLQDRNTELVIADPFSQTGPSPSPSPSPSPGPAPSPSPSPAPRPSPSPRPQTGSTPPLPQTGPPVPLGLGGALLLAAAGGLHALRRPRP